jgi:hypothetical protein
MQRPKRSHQLGQFVSPIRFVEQGRISFDFHGTAYLRSRKTRRVEDFKSGALDSSQFGKFVAIDSTGHDDIREVSGRELVQLARQIPEARAHFCLDVLGISPPAAHSAATAAP